MRKLSLFSGILGDDLASEWAGIETVCCVEIDPFCQAVIKKHYPDMPIIGDIHDVTKAKLKEVSGCEWVDIISGGDPCQPRSVAGKRRGREDDRDLWKDMFRVVCELKPAWVVNENPTGRLTMDFHEVLSDLESQGYETRSFVIPACAVNAPHRRDRVYIVAYSSAARAECIGRAVADKGQTTSENRGKGIRQRNWAIGTGGADSTNQYGDARNSDVRDRNKGKVGEVAQKQSPEPARTGCDIEPVVTNASVYGFNRYDKESDDARRFASHPEQSRHRWSSRIKGCDRKFDTNTLRQGLEIGLESSNKRGTLRQERTPSSQTYLHEPEWNENWLEVAAALCGVDDGLPARVARLKALGNAQVPQQVYPIYKAIVEVDRTFSSEEKI